VGLSGMADVDEINGEQVACNQGRDEGFVFKVHHNAMP